MIVRYGTTEECVWFGPESNTQLLTPVLTKLFAYRTVPVPVDLFVHTRTVKTILKKRFPDSDSAYNGNKNEKESLNVIL